MPSGYNIRPQIEAQAEARLNVQRRYQRQYHRRRRVRLRAKRYALRSFTREELASKMRQINPDLDAATLAWWLDAVLAEQEAWVAAHREARP